LLSDEGVGLGVCARILARRPSVQEGSQTGV
jgi:hypothetical protein